MDHAQMVMACRFGWNAGPDNGMQTPTTMQSPPVRVPLRTSINATQSKRFMSCRGGLRHQLTCSHRIRTDVVEDCGANCVDPLCGAQGLPFYCHECVEKEASRIWSEREAQHNASYPPIDQMTKPQYEQWYDEYRQVESQFAKDRGTYELELRIKTRPSNMCSVLELSKEEIDFAAELDSLSLALIPSNDIVVGQHRTSRTSRTSLPYDASEQLHWDLNALSLERGSCGVEYSVNQPTNGPSLIRPLDEEELWRKPRSRN